MRHQFLFGGFAMMLALSIGAGCSKQPDAKVKTQVAAKVNGDEITVHQVNHALARSPSAGPNPEAIVQTKNKILDTLIEQQLAKQQAIAGKLDRSPPVLQAMEAARNEILARAYLEGIAASQPEPTSSEIKQYYAAHPELFAQRRVFNLEEIVVQGQENLAAPLRNHAQKVRSMPEIAAWLKARDARFDANRGVRAAEQIPLEWLPKLHAMKDGEFQVIEASGRLHVFHLVNSQSAPVDEATANARIQSFLRNQRSSKAVAQEIERLKGSATIVYVGDFSREASGTPTQSADGAPAAAAAPPPTPEVEKGARGLF